MGGHFRSKHSRVGAGCCGADGDAMEAASKAEMLRGVVAEKLTTAAREILLVVERTVAGYEAEASGLRQELDRQRKQLEELLQQRVKLETIDDQFPVCDPGPGPGLGLGLGPGLGPGPGGAELSDEEQHKPEPDHQILVCGPAGRGAADEGWQRSNELRQAQGLDRDGSLGLIVSTEAQMDDQDPDQDQDQDPDQDQENPAADEEASRSMWSPSRHRFEGLRRSGEAGTQDLIHLRIRVLDDSQINVLSAHVFKKYPVHNVSCPRGLQEADFLRLLRSTFPQLSARRNFDIFTSGRSNRLQVLDLDPLTPEGVYRKVAGTGHTAVFIRLKGRQETESTIEDEEPPQREDAAADAPPGPDRTRAPSDPQRPGRDQDYIELRIRILEDVEDDVRMTGHALRMFPILELQCPRGLQEPDFLQLLRSSFPQLAAERRFHFFKSNKRKRLQPLALETLTPEEVHRTTGPAVLYIWLKELSEVQTRTKTPDTKSSSLSLRPKMDQRNPDQRNPDRRKSDQRKPDQRKPGHRRLSKQQKHVDLRICILEDSQIHVLSREVYRKYGMQELQCPRGLQEVDFLQLLSSAFPQLAAGKRPFDLFTTDRSKRLQPLRVEALTPDEVHRSVGHSALYIRLKTQVGVEPREEQRQTGPNSRRPAPRLEEEADPEDSRPESVGLWPPMVHSESEGDASEADEWKPKRGQKRPADGKHEAPARKRHGDGSGARRRSSGESRSSGGESRASGGESRASGGESRASGGASLCCKVCQRGRGSTNMLIKHAWSHVDAPERLCGVCGERCPTSDELRTHLQSHQKTLSCNICGKSFLSTNGLSGHIARHKGQRPHQCKICHKRFVHKWVLKTHLWTHEQQKPHSCQRCPKTFATRLELERHWRVHHCSSGSESLSGLKALTQQVLTQQALTQQVLTESCSEAREVCNVCHEAFGSKLQLKLHKQSHRREKPYTCPVCDKSFGYKHCLRRHMALHQDRDQDQEPGTEAALQILSSRVNGAKNVAVVKRVQ